MKNPSKVLANVPVGWNQTEQDRKFLDRFKEAESGSNTVSSPTPNTFTPLLLKESE